MIHTLSTFLIRFRLPLFLLSLVFAGVMASGLSQLSHKTDYRVMFSSHNEYLEAFEHLQDTYTRVDNVVFILAPHNGNALSADGLRAQQWLTEQGWLLPYSIRVDSLSNFQYTYAEGDELLVEDMVPADFDGSADAISVVEKRVNREQTIRDHYLSPDGALSVVMVTLELPEDQTLALPEMMETKGGVLELEAAFRAAHPTVDLHVTGLATSNYYLGTVLGKDMQILIPAMLVVALVLVGVMTRSVANTFVTFFVVILSITVTMGGFGFTGIPLNNINSVAPVVILTLAVAHSVHLLCYYSQRLREGHDKVTAMQLSLESNLRAIFFTTFTTAVGFLGMLTIDAPPFVQFGCISAAGIITAYLFGHTLLPQLAIWLSRPARETQTQSGIGFHLKMADWVIRHARPVFYSTLVVSALLSTGMALNDLNDDNVGYFNKEMPVRVAMDLAESHGMGMNFIAYSIDSGEEYGITDPAYLQKVEAFIEWAKQQPEIVTASAFTDVLKRLNQTLHGDDPAWYRLPDSRELASQYMLMYEMSLPMGMDLNDQTDTSKASMRVMIGTRMMKAKEILALEDKVQAWMAANMPELQTHGTGPTIMFAHIGQNSIKSAASGSLVAITIICLCMIFGFGSVRLGLMALLPNIFPSTIAIGLWGIFSGEVNVAIAVIFTISSGIIVDDTIHLFSKFADGLRKGLGVNDSIRYSFEHAGLGVLITTVVLASGFAMLALSDFNINKMLGILVSGTILIAILFDLLFLPSVLKVFPIDRNLFYKPGAGGGNPTPALANATTVAPLKANASRKVKKVA